VGGALRAIVNSEVPRPRAVTSRRVWRGEAMELLALGRAGAPDEVPAIWAAPSEGRWSGKVLVVVSDDAGRGAVGLSPEGGKIDGLAALALSRGAAVLAPDVFLTGRLVPAGRKEGEPLRPPVDPKRHGAYCGYTFGYNRTPLAERVHDVLTAVGYALSVPGTHTVDLVGVGEGGLWALLAKGIAEGAVRRVLADRPGFDFSELKDVSDLRMCPGGVKYGGWAAFAALSAPDPLSIRGLATAPPILEAAYRAAGVPGSLRMAGDAGLARAAEALLLSPTE